MSIHVLALHIELRIPQSHSLKEKRRVLRPVLDGLKNRNVSVAEVARHDEWQHAELGVALVGQSPGDVEQSADSVERFIWDRVEAEVVRIDRLWLDDA